jgi:2-amino-4-hydroxy-6-hydroxymethyldihydropteridine diphosphokinase
MVSDFNLDWDWNRTAFIALGSNVGDRAHILQEAMSRVAALSSGPVKSSSLWITTPVDCPPGSAFFLNAVMAITLPASLTVEQLLDQLHQLEKDYGRGPRIVRNEPRPLDLDLITFGSRICHTAQLTLPHPRAHLRRFVLQPLAEIAPNLVLPGQTRTVADLLRELPPDSAMRKYAEA